MGVADEQVKQVRSSKFAPGHQACKKQVGNGVFGLCNRIVGLHDEVTGKRPTSFLANSRDVLERPGEHFAERISAMVHLLASPMNCGAESVGNGRCDDHARPMRRLQGLRTSVKAPPRPSELGPVHRINTDAENVLSMLRGVTQGPIDAPVFVLLSIMRA
jgi:hypothetical protein